MHTHTYTCAHMHHAYPHPTHLNIVRSQQTAVTASEKYMVPQKDFTFLKSAKGFVIIFLL